MFDSADIEVEATTEAEAAEKAMAILVRPFYRIKSVSERCSELELRANGRHDD